MIIALSIYFVVALVGAYMFGKHVGDAEFWFIWPLALVFILPFACFYIICFPLLVFFAILTILCEKQGGKL